MRPARYDLLADRYVSFVQTFDLEGYDLTAANANPFFAAQVRPIRDAGIQDSGPVPPLIDLPMVANDSTGIKVLGVRQQDGVPITTIRMFIDQQVMKALPYAAERGDDMPLAWDLQFSAVNVVKGYLLFGDFIVVARATFS